MITRINESKTLSKHVSCKCKSKFGGKECNSNQKRNNGKCHCDCKNPKACCVEKILFEILACVLLKIVNRRYYWWLTNYVWWNYRSDKNYSNKNYFIKNYFNKF